MKKILLVDDNRSVLEILRALLRRSGYAVESAQSSREAWERLNAGDIDLMICDVMMPEMDGFELGKRLQDDQALATIPIIYLTALDSLEDEFEGFMSGAVDYVTKPFKARELLEKVEAVLHKKSAGMPLVFRRATAKLEVASVLVLCSDEKLLDRITAPLEADGYRIEMALAEPPSLSRLAGTEEHHIVIAHLSDTGLSADDITRFFANFKLSIPLIVITAGGKAPEALKTLASSVHDAKDNLQVLRTACRHALGRRG